MKTLERRYSKSERIIARARFSAWVFLRQFFLAAVLGGIIACVWIWNAPIENFFLRKSGEAIYLTDNVMKWCCAGAGAFVFLCVILQMVSLWSRELIVTENKLIYRVGVIAVKSADISINTIKSVEYDATIIERLLRYGKITVIVDAEKPYVIRGISSADRLARRIMKQVSANTNEAEKQLLNIKLTGSVSKKQRH